MTSGYDDLNSPAPGQWPQSKPAQEGPGYGQAAGYGQPGASQGQPFDQPTISHEQAFGQPGAGRGLPYGQPGAGQVQPYGPPGAGQGQYNYQQYAQPQPGAYPPVPYQGYQPQPMIMPKNPGISVLLSFFIPGLGSMLNDRVGVGVAILVTYIVGVFLLLFIIGGFVMLGAWIWGMVDAYQSAVAWNRARGIAS